MKLPASHESWRRVAAILDRTLEMPTAERGAYLDRACAGDPALRAEAEELLAADEAAGNFLATPAGDYAEALLTTGPEVEETALAVDRLVGRQLGPYRVERRIGAGGMGVVYEALDTRLERSVALKLLPAAYGHDPEAKERFIREARAASALDHPNICTVHDVGESDDGRIFIVMAYYRGETLRQKLRHGPLAATEARELAIQVARGLAQAHEAGIVHRDVKPANVIVSERGEAKILDFGIAKIAGQADLTRPGDAPATPAYISPERARGEDAGVLADVWSLGVMLYEMLAGRRPFPGDDAQAVIYQILNREPEPLEEVCPQAPAALARTVAKAMAKDPAARHGHVAELLAELEGATPPPAASARPGRKRRIALAAVLFTGLSALGGWWAVRDVDSSGRHSLAVLRFENLSGEQQLEWLRYGLADLMITDLSQSPEIDVLDLRRLDQILASPQDSGGGGPPVEQLRRLSREAETVLEGSFVRSGERLRINFSVRETASGRILFRDWVEDPAERLFAMVDKVSRETRRGFGVPQRVELADTVAEVTTSSYEAWRLFSEGRELGRQSRWQEARPLFEQAVAVDSTFALALADLGNLHVNLGHQRVAREYSRRATERADRLPLQQRYFVEAEFYSGSWSGYARAIEAYRQGLELFPDDLGLRSNLASHMVYLERYEEAVRVYQAAIDRGDDYAGTYYGAATAQGALNDFETGGKILAQLVHHRPDDGFAQLAMGWNLTDGGRLEAAAEALRRAAALSPGDFNVRQGWWRWRILRQDWEGAARDGREMAASSDPHDRWLGLVCDAWTGLYGGHSRPAMERFAEATRAYSEPEGNTALSHCWTARLLLQTGRPVEALAAAQRARQEAPGDWPELAGLFLSAVAQQALGRPMAADRLAEALGERAEQRPNRGQQRQLRHLAGRLALARGETGRALRELTAAAALLPPRGFWFHWHVLPEHVPLWYALGEAELAAGRPRNAAEWFRKVTSSGTEHLGYPVLFVRSFYRLGKIHEALGDAQSAAEAYGRFHDYWRDGDLDREQVEEATAKSTSSD